ncbi:MAG: hypothetical protein AUG51_08785 [Acidobacteria bacterium 13_1_20CM_3_53_8]|nr:MAG: hypothetical protein AUG51_08785 [Acidobacteria bacterium 13_1_20CM_3_53_8]
MPERADIIDTLRRFLDVNRNRTGKSIILFLLGIICLGWIVSALYGLFDILSRGVFGLLGANKLLADWKWSLGVAFLNLAFSLIAFSGIYWLMKRHLKPNSIQTKTILFETPSPHNGLIFLLGPYKHRDQSRYGAFNTIYLDDADTREQLLKSNWGPLVVAVQHHAQSSTLKHCWLICTQGQAGSALQFEKAEEVIKHFAGKKVKCHKREVASMNDVGEVAKVVNKIYESAPLGENLMPEQIIADFTGGTAAMSGGLIIATLLKDRHVQYFSQDPDKPIFKEDGQAFTPQEIAETNALITVVISTSLQPAEIADADNEDNLVKMEI